MLRRVMFWLSAAFLGAVGVVGLLSALEGGGPAVFKNEVGAGATFAGLNRSDWYYRGTVIASDPNIVRTENGFDLFYTDLDVSKGRTVIAKATSTDGRNWETSGTVDGVNGVVMAGRDGEWDENTESVAVVRRDDGGWLLYFSGYRDEGSPYRGFPAALWAATSSDGRSFARVSPDPIMTPTRGWYDNDAIYSPTVLFEDGVYHMIYVGHAYTDVSQIPTGGVYLLAAKSTDGITWEKVPTPLAGPGQFDGWRSDGVAEPYLVKQGPGSYLLFYTGLGGEERAIGVATASSPDGPWDFGSAPVIKPGAPGAPDDHQVLAPAAVVEADGRVRLWYLAANKEEMLSIGQVDGSVAEMLSASRN